MEETRPLPADGQTSTPAPQVGPSPNTEPASKGRIVVVMPAYNAARTLERTYRDIPADFVSQIILVDDVSKDETVAIARQLGLEVIIHRQNLGYGKMDLMLGSRFLGDPLAGGMPRWKYISNRFLTGVENMAFGLHLSEYHTGFRAYSRQLLESIPYRLNSNDFVFDQELVAQAVACGMRIGEIAVPTRYFEEASSVGFRRSVVYGLSTLKVVLRFLLHRIKLRRSPKLTRR